MDWDRNISHRPFVVGIGGTLRSNSSSELAMKACLNAASEEGAEILAICGSELALPMYSPTTEIRSADARKLIQSLRRADGIVLSSPSYHGSVSGLVKNAIDYIEDMSGDEFPYLHGRAVGCIACGAGWNGTGQTLAHMRAIVHALRGWPTPMGAVLNTAEKGADSKPAWMEPRNINQIEVIGRQIVEFAVGNSPKYSLSGKLRCGPEAQFG